MSERAALDIRGFRGRAIRNALWSWGSNRLALVFPGWSYGAQAPLLWYARQLFVELGFDVLAVDYRYDELEGFAELDGEEQDRIFREEVRAAAEAAADRYRWLTLVGKSIGTQAVAFLAGGGHPATVGVDAIFLTPTLNHPPLREAIAGLKARSLFVIGTEDPSYRPELLEVAAAAGEVVAIDGADHSLEVGDSPERSLEAVGAAIAAVRRFASIEPAVRERVAAEFAADERDVVLAELGSITLDHVMARSPRNLFNTRLAVLTLAAGDLDALAEAVAAARLDFRDVILWAERR